MPDLKLERSFRIRGFLQICGVDEAGRGPWAGPVVAAAANLAGIESDEDLIGRLDDSKKLSGAVRTELFDELVDRADTAVGIASVAEIDALNILAATMLAMQRAVAGLKVAPDVALIDGNRAPELDCAVRPVIKGDAVSCSIAAASIVAKVTRDRMMVDLAAAYPGYGWERNAGYGTAEHKAALAGLGVTPVHRRSFAPIRRLLADEPA